MSEGKDKRGWRPSRRELLEAGVIGAGAYLTAPYIMGRPDSSEPPPPPPPPIKPAKTVDAGENNLDLSIRETAQDIHTLRNMYGGLQASRINSAEMTVIPPYQKECGVVYYTLNDNKDQKFILGGLSNLLRSCITLEALHARRHQHNTGKVPERDRMFLIYSDIAARVTEEHKKIFGSNMTKPQIQALNLTLAETLETIARDTLDRNKNTMLAERIEGARDLVSRIMNLPPAPQHTPSSEELDDMPQRAELLNSKDIQMKYPTMLMELKGTFKLIIKNPSMQKARDELHALVPATQTEISKRP